MSANSNPTAAPQSGPRFEVGQVFATPGATEALAEVHGNRWKIELLKLVNRHRSGDWGVVCPDDAAANESALEHEARLLSAYHLPARVPAARPVKVWIITEADRSSTTLLLPEEY